MTTEERFRQIYDTTYRQTAAQILAKSRQSADAADLIQEVYLEVYTILQRRGQGYIRNPVALVGKITRQALARYYRTMSHRQEVYDASSEEEITAEMEDIHALSVEEIAADREVLLWTDRYLRKRGEEVRKIFHLYYRFGMTVPGIARLLGRTESDVKNKLYRTLKEISTYWKGEET